MPHRDPTRPCPTASVGGFSVKIHEEPDAIHSLAPQGSVSLPEIRQIVGAHIALTANINCWLLQAGTDVAGARGRFLNLMRKTADFSSAVLHFISMESL